MYVSNDMYMTLLVLWGRSGWRGGGGGSGLPLEIVAFLAHSHPTISLCVQCVENSTERQVFSQNWTVMFFDIDLHVYPKKSRKGMGQRNTDWSTRSYKHFDARTCLE